MKSIFENLEILLGQNKEYFFNLNKRTFFDSSVEWLGDKTFTSDHRPIYILGMPRSGTTLLEAFYIGWDAVGIDRNPLASKIANAKLTMAGCVKANLLATLVQLEKPLKKIATEFDADKEIPDKLKRELLPYNWYNSFSNWDYLANEFL